MSNAVWRRRLLRLEAQIQELSTRLNNSGQSTSPLSGENQQRPYGFASTHENRTEELRELRHSRLLSATDANVPSELTGSQHRLHGLDRENPDHSQAPTASPPTQMHHSNDGDHSYQFFGSTSGVVFASAVRDFVQRLGYDIIPAAGTWQNSLHQSESTRYSQEHEPAQVAHLLALLPPQRLAARLLDVFKTHTYDYTPAIDWSSIVDKFRRLYTRPVSATPPADFVKDFCLLNAVWSVGSQMCEYPELRHECGDHVKNGWRFFTLARQYHDIMVSSYDLDDAAILLLQSVYLQGASLPNTCWALVGLTSRVIQDLGLHTHSRSRLFTPAEMEIRNRLFWCAYLVDQKVALSLGRTVALPKSDCSVDLPQHTDIICSASSDSISIFRVSIEVVSTLHDIIAFSPSGQEARDITFLSDIDQTLSRCWEKYPRRMRDFSAPDAYEPSSLKLLCVLLQARLTTMRHFTDTALPIGYRKWCFTRSVHVSAITLATVTTLVHTPRWQSKVALLCNDAVFSHVFQAAMVLVLADSPCAEALGHPAEKHCISTLWKFLLAVVARHTAVRKYLHLLNTLVKTLGTQLDDDGSSQRLSLKRSHELQFPIGSPHVGSSSVPAMHHLANHSLNHPQEGPQNHSYEMPPAQAGLTLFSKSETSFPHAPVQVLAPVSVSSSSPPSWQWPGIGDNFQRPTEPTAQDSSVNWDLLSQIMMSDSSGFPFVVDGFENDV